MCGCHRLRRHQLGERHNRALQVTTRNDIPTHTLYYEEYSTDFNGTVKLLLDFLEIGPSFREADGKSFQPELLEPLSFLSGKTIYFSGATIRTAKQVVKALATSECWKLLRRYFA
jgi:hypothetical protein